MNTTITIYVHWDRYGWLADSPGSCACSGHCAGPRMAAEQVAEMHFGIERYKLKKGGLRLQYIAEMKEEA